MALRDQLKVLVVDDMSTSRGLIAQALDAMGIRQVATTEGGPGALQILEKSPVHLVISDFNMPQMNGLEMLKELRGGGDKTPFGFVTSEGTPEMRQAAVDAGAMFLIVKPFTADDFEKTLGPVLAAA